MGIGRGYFADQLGQLLVGQIPAAGQAAIVADQRLVETIRLQVPKFLGGMGLGAVAAVVKERHIPRFGLGQVIAKASDDRSTGGRLVGQHQGRPVVVGTTDTGSQQLFHAADVIYTAV